VIIKLKILNLFRENKINNLRFATINSLKEVLNKKSIREHAVELGITIYGVSGKYNKGWVGQTIDRLLKTQQVNGRFPDGIDFELKSVSGFINKNNGIVFD